MNPKWQPIGAIVATVLSIATVVVAGCNRATQEQSPTTTPRESQTTQSSAGTSPATPTAVPPSAPAAGSAPADQAPVPGVKQAELGDPCSDTEHFIFAVSAGGQQLACRGEPGRYEFSAPVIGVRERGAPCTEEGLAQSADGSPMLCLEKSGQRIWDIYLDY